MTRHPGILTVALLAWLTAACQGASDQDLIAAINDHYRASWAAEGLTPSARSTDEEFARRIYLDLVGTIPPVPKLLAFLDDPADGKRDALISRLLASPAFAEYWATVWTARLIGRRALFNDEDLYHSLVDWLEVALRDGMPYDQMARELIAATGSNRQQGNAAFLIKWAQTPADMTGKVTRTFMGFRTQCAQCHDHPYESFSQREFWQTAAYFGRTRAMRLEDRMTMFAGYRLFDQARGGVRIPGQKDVVPPKYVLSPSAKAPPAASRRAVFAKHLTDRQNPLFGQALVNWTWAQFFGRGFVNPVDDFSLNGRNTAEHAEILKRLADHFVANGYDFRRLIRIIVSTDVYHLSSLPSANNTWDRVHLSRAPLRPISPEQQYNTFIDVFGITQLRAKRHGKGGADRLLTALRANMRAYVHLYDNDEMTETASFENTIPQALFMMNGLANHHLLHDRDSWLQAILRREKWRQQRLEAVFLTILSRHPDKEEIRRFRRHVSSGRNSVKAYADVAWTLLNSTEFLYNH